MFDKAGHIYHVANASCWELNGHATGLQKSMPGVTSGTVKKEVKQKYTVLDCWTLTIIAAEFDY